MVVACQNLINLFENAFFLFKPHIPYGYVHLFAFLPDDIVNIGLHFILKNVRPYAASYSEA